MWRYESGESDKIRVGEDDDCKAMKMCTESAARVRGNTHMAWVWILILTYIICLHIYMQ